MHTRLLCLWVLGVVSGADDQFQRPIYVIPPSGAPPGYSNGQPFYGAPVSSNSVRVLPNAYGTSQGVFPSSGGDGNSVPVPVEVNNNTPFQGIVNQPIPVPVAYDSTSTEGTQPAYGTSTIPIQKNTSPNVTPVPVLVKAPESAYRSVVSTPTPFTTRKPLNEEALGNPYSTVSPKFRLWPKLPEPVPVPVLASDAFVRNSYRNSNANLVPQYLQKVPVPVKPPTSLLNRFQQNFNPVSPYSENNQIQTQPSQQSNQGPIYLIIPRGNNIGQFGSGAYQNSPQTQASYQNQSPQTGNQGFIILAAPGSNLHSNQAAYQNDGYFSNQAYYGNQQQSQPAGFSPQNFAVIGPFTASGNPYQTQSGQQSGFNYAVPSNVPGSQSQATVDQQSALKYTIFGPINAPINSAGQSAPNYSTFAPSDGVNQIKPEQSPFTFAVFPPNTESSYPSSTPSSTQYNRFSTTQPTAQYSGYSTTQSSPQYSSYSTQAPQYVGYSSTPAPPTQPTYSQSTPISRVSFSGAGGSYNYSI